MQQDLNRVIDQVSKEKGMDRGVIIEALESAMLSAARRTFGQKQIEAKFNPDIGEIELFEIKTVVEQVANADTEVSLQTLRIFIISIGVLESLFDSQVTCAQEIFFNQEHTFTPRPKASGMLSPRATPINKKARSCLTHRFSWPARTLL